MSRSRGKGRMAVIPRFTVERVTQPGLSPGERRQASFVARVTKGTATSFAVPTGGKKRNRRRARLAKAARRRNR